MNPTDEMLEQQGLDEFNSEFRSLRYYKDIPLSVDSNAKEMERMERFEETGRDYE